MEFKIDYTPSSSSGAEEAWPSAPLGVPEEPLPRAPTDEKKDNPMGLGIGEIGMSVPFGIAAGNVEGVQAKIRAGAGRLELAFPGSGGGNRQAQVPGMYGEEQRQALREISKINEVEFTTHASYSVMGTSGMDQGGNLSIARGKQAYDEIVRAIEFAKDVASGGSVVVHVGEFERPLTHIYPEGFELDEKGRPAKNYARDEKTGRLMFQKHPFELEKAQFLLVDERTGQGFQTVQADRRVAQPEWLRAKEDYTYIDEQGREIQVKKGDYIDYEGRPVEDPYAIRFERGVENKFKGARVPEIDPKTGRFKTRMVTLKDFEKEAREYNEYFRKIMGRDPTPEERMTPREMYLKSTLYTRAGYAYGWAMQFTVEVPELIEKLKKLKEIRNFYEKLDKSLPEEEKWKIMRSDSRIRTFWHDLLPPETKNPLEIIDKDIAETQKRLEYAWQSGNTQELEAMDQFETMRHLKTPEKFIEKNTLQYYAMAGIKAAEASQGTKKPIFVALEHIFPEQYGGHPQELKWIIKNARRKMVELMTNPNANVPKEVLPPEQQNQDINPFYKPGISKEEAEKLAARHIRATIDTGHLNMWKKYFVEDPNKSRAENEKAFKEWMVKQVEDLAKEGMVGNIHLTDNFGYHDVHLAPGQGNAPIKEIVGVLKKYGYSDAFTVEPGADATTDNSDFHGLMKTWRHFGSSIYSMGGPVRVGAPPASFADVQYSYFGRTYPPNFIFGAYAPSNDWTLWSGVQLE